MKTGLWILLLAILIVVPCHAQVLMEHKLLASDGAKEQFFGRSLSLSGDRLLVGADGQDVQRLRTPGTAYIFERQGDASWTEVAMFRHDGATNGDLFGATVDLEGDRGIIAAPQRFVDGVKTGTAFIVERQSDGSWIQVAQLNASDGATDDALGNNAVSISGDRALVGANGHDLQGTASGAAYIFERQSDGSWIETAKLLPSDIAAFSNVGRSVVLEGERAFVGASFAVYIFELQGNAWVETGKITPQNPNDSFGISVDVFGDRLLVGANTTTENGIQSGAAYVFELQSDGTWAEQATLVADDATAFMHLGFRVSLTTHRALVSAWRDNLMGQFVGSAYVFLRSENGTWAQQAKLTASDGGSNDLFGVSASMDGDHAVLGASGANDFDSQSGAVYLYDLAPVSVNLEEDLIAPNTYTISDPYPNPFSSSTQFSATLDHPQSITIEVFNMLGERIQVLHQGMQPADTQLTFKLDSHSLPAGVYFVRFIGEHFTATRTVLSMQ